jgi:avirulence protein
LRCHRQASIQLWTYARDWRGSLAGDPGGRIFGLASARMATQRSDMDNISPMTDQYRYIRDLYEHRSGGVVEPSMFPGVIPDSIRFQAMDSIEGQPIALTTMVMSTDPSADRNAPAYRALREQGYGQFSEPFHIEYTPVPESQRIMDHAETLYRRATDPGVKPPQALATIAELHWWLSHGMPDQRGSAAKAELSVRAIAQARGIDLPPLRHGIVLDLEAMTTLRADFVKNYVSYFSRPPDVPD